DDPSPERGGRRAKRGEGKSAEMTPRPARSARHPPPPGEGLEFVAPPATAPNAPPLPSTAASVQTCNDLGMFPPPLRVGEGGLFHEESVAYESRGPKGEVRGAPNILAALDEDQRRAAEIIEGPLLIVAGPGSGKTRVLTHRIAHLLARGV